MADYDPFLTYISSETTNWIMRFLERRWGLALVSFLPLDAQQWLVQLQHEISRLIVGEQDNEFNDSRTYIEYHNPEQFHCTHFVLARKRLINPFFRKLRGIIHDNPKSIIMEGHHDEGETIVISC